MGLRKQETQPGLCPPSEADRHLTAPKLATFCISQVEVGEHGILDSVLDRLGEMKRIFKKKDIEYEYCAIEDFGNSKTRRY